MAIKRCLSKEVWRQRIEEWRASGKGCRAWCQENSIAYTTFITWRRRLTEAKPIQDQNSHFVELTTTLKSNNTLTLECADVKIYLSADFDEKLLGKCLRVLRGIPC